MWRRVHRSPARMLRDTRTPGHRGHGRRENRVPGVLAAAPGVPTGPGSAPHTLLERIAHPGSRASQPLPAGRRTAAAERGETRARTHTHIHTPRTDLGRAPRGSQPHVAPELRHRLISLLLAHRPKSKKGKKGQEKEQAQARPHRTM
ncbi:hypothetical protein POSPLADRAFT_1054254 [Postia placenta MAD-698-R-SB12]|uniref:Uncharacterized protein n=1 Tax=Postia placenta MAD-698-R-SB12 TaxID=670580 RepID=A0A1X6NA48_9APHY|nr:hypothetical protein POSPLADRAFT_1054254 [Postia placenta MAD-698-R-SB12]OSX65515.1 hypothetical protein POSPLADRAFT_1054254 [Postia placenta MAD-698-R-SB12]